MRADKTSNSWALGAGVARRFRVALAAAAFAVCSVAVPEWSLTAASIPAAEARPAAEPLTTLPAESGGALQSSGLGVDAHLALARPHVLAGDVADVLVRVRGGLNCTGIPIAGTAYVVTAAHCVLDADGEVSGRTVLRDGVEYEAESVLVNTDYHDSPGAHLDAAVLILGEHIDGPSATLGATLPSQGLVTLAGFQPVDSDGSLLRGTRSDNRPVPRGVTGGVVQIESVAAGCVHPLPDVEITNFELKVPCGLIPGSSGGGLFVENNGEPILVGIISTVAHDLTYNGVVPLSALNELLAHPHEYTHEISVPDFARAGPPRFR